MTTVNELTPADRAVLASARQALENPSLTGRVADMIGRPIDGLVKMLPDGARGMAHDVVQKALHGALGAALKTLRDEPGGRSRKGMHRAVVGATGALGGIFGFAGLAVELPVSTAVMLRSIAEIARSEGEDLSSPQTHLECLSVFALGGRSAADDAAESAYFAVRAALAKAVSEAAQHLAAHGVVARGAPIIARVVAQVAGRFEAAVAQKVAMQSVPILGGAIGAAINVAFIQHFQAIASAHFTVRRLEREYGQVTVRQAYRELGGAAGGGEPPIG
jgi:hypothetical protein